MHLNKIYNHENLNLHCKCFFFVFVFSEGIEKLLAWAKSNTVINKVKHFEQSF